MSDAALSTTPLGQQGFSVGLTKSFLTKALAVEGASLDPAVRDALVEAATKALPVDATLAAYDALTAHYDTLGPILKARTIDVATDIAVHGYHGRAAEAQAFILDPKSPPPPPPEEAPAAAE